MDECGAAGDEESRALLGDADHAGSLPATCDPHGHANDGSFGNQGPEADRFLDGCGPSGSMLWHLYTLAPRDVQALLRHERAEARVTSQSASQAGSTTPAADASEACLTRWEVLRAKAALGCVLLTGLGLAMLLAYVGRGWLRCRLQAGMVPPAEAALLVGVAMPAVLAAFLCVLEHSEWRYLRMVSPQSQLPYTPFLHEVMPRLRQAFS